MNKLCVKILRVLRLNMLPVDIMHEQTVQNCTAQVHAYYTNVGYLEGRFPGDV